MAKENKKETNTQIASEIAKDVYNIINKHITTRVVYADAVQVAQKQTVENATELLDDMSTMFDKKYNIYPFKSLNDMTWEEIKDTIHEGFADKAFAVGDTKSITLTTGEKAEVVIIGFNHDAISGANTKAGITFAFKNILDGWFEMNETETNDGGWAKSKMRNSYMQRLFTVLPKDLQNLIVPVDKVTGVGGGQNKTEITQDKLFLLSQREVFGNDDDVAVAEGEQYPYFENEENRIACRNNNDTYWWWLRSPYLADSYSFCYVGSGGSANQRLGYWQWRRSPCFLPLINKSTRLVRVLGGIKTKCQMKCLYRLV